MYFKDLKQAMQQSASRHLVTLHNIFVEFEIPQVHATHKGLLLALIRDNKIT